jgi:hypothetical protein
MIGHVLGNEAQHEAAIAGNVDGIHGGRLSGWALDLREPRRRLLVTLEGLAAGAVTVVADRYRADLQHAGVGDGYSGFALPIAQPYGQLRVTAGSPPVVLPGGPPQSDARRLHRRDNFALYLDNIDPRSGVTGWARDAERPCERQTLRLRDASGRVLAVQRATLYRPDLAGAGCDGFHGFGFLPLPSGVVGPLHLESAMHGHIIVLTE